MKKSLTIEVLIGYVSSLWLVHQLLYQKAYSHINYFCRFGQYFSKTLILVHTIGFLPVYCVSTPLKSNEVRSTIEARISVLTCILSANITRSPCFQITVASPVMRNNRVQTTSSSRRGGREEYLHKMQMMCIDNYLLNMPYEY